MILTKKGASEVIVAIMVVMVTVILATIFFAWMKETSKNQLDETSNELRQASDFTCMNATFVIESCVIDSSSKDVNILLMNNSELRLFNIILSIHAENTSIVGRFEKLVDPGEISKLSTSSDFTYIDGNQSVLSSLDLDTIENMILTNGACPKKTINLDCDIS